MPTTIEHQAIGVKYVWTFNQNVETGTFWDSSPYVVSKPGLKMLSMSMETADGTAQPNTIVPNLELGFFGKPGFKGEVYINGLAKNPKGVADYDKDGKERNYGCPFDSRNFGTFNEGWTQFRHVRDPVTKKNIKVPLPTNLASSYPEFNLNEFMDVHNKLKSGEGIAVETGDVLVAHLSNFDINCPHTWQIQNAGGYPYQKIRSRSCVMSYGTLFVLASHPAEPCFRPPVVWPEEDYKNRPLHPVSKAVANLPTEEELVENPSKEKYDRVPSYTNEAYRTFMYGFALGGGISYSQRLPLFVGAGTENLTNSNVPSAYGAYYQGPILGRLSSLYAKGATEAARIEALKCVVQWGIDAYGSLKTYTRSGAGAGQKPVGTRAWSIVAGYFLGETAMRMPETTMLADTKRAEGFFKDEPNDDKVWTITTGVPQNHGKSATWKQWKAMIYGDSSTINGKKKHLARLTSQEGITYVKVVDDPANYILHYDYIGASHRRKFGGEGGTFSQTSTEEKIPIYGVETLTHRYTTGNYAKINWIENIPQALTGWPLSHDGKQPTFPHAYVKVTEGPGSGDTLYRILYPWGSLREANAGGKSTNPRFLGYGWVLDRPWANGTPDQTSKFELITTTKENVGEPFYIIQSSQHHPTIVDANLSPNTPYGPICESLVVRIYGWMNYIKLKTGQNADLDADSTFAHEYVHRILFTTPYNIVSYSSGYIYNGARRWEIGVLDKWYDRSSNDIELAKLIDPKKIPGILTWCGIPVKRKIVGDFNDDGVVDQHDLAMLIPLWGSVSILPSEFDLDGDGIVGVNDARMLLDLFESEDTGFDMRNDTDGVAEEEETEIRITEESEE